MEPRIYLVNQQQANFTPDPSGPSRWTASVFVRLEPLNRSDGSQLHQIPQLSELFPDGPQLFPASNRIAICLQLEDGGSINFASHPVFTSLKEVLGAGNYEVHMEFECGRLSINEYVAEGGPLTFDPDKDQYRAELKIPSGRIRDWVSRMILRLKGTITLKLVLYEAAITRIIQTEQDFNLGQRMLEAGNKDFLLRTFEGDVECHRVVLAASSPVFQAMMESKFCEADSGILQMVGMTRGGVEALVRYLYTGYIPGIVDCDVVHQLLEVGHAFDIIGLVDKITPLILIQPYSWFTVEIAKRMVGLADCLEEMKNVGKKATEALRWHRIPTVSQMDHYGQDSLLEDVDSMAVEE